MLIITAVSCVGEVQMRLLINIMQSDRVRY